MTTLLDFYRRVSLNPKWRYYDHAQHLIKHTNISSKRDKENFDNIYNTFLETIKKITKVQFIDGIIFILLYLSVINTFVSVIWPYFEAIIKPINAIVSLIGFSVLFLVHLYLRRIYFALLTDLNIEHTHLVALAVKHSDNKPMRLNYGFLLYKKYD